MLRIFLFYWLIPWVNGDEADLFDEKDPRSRMMIVNGHMYFHSGYGKNITFVSQGPGSIWIGDTDISHLPSIMDLDVLKDHVDVLNDGILAMKPRLESSSRTMVAMANITRNIITVTRNISIDVKMLREWKKDRITKDAKLRKYLNRISKGIRLLLDSFKSDPCEVKPCEGGATCIPRFGTKFYCFCPPHRTGPKCENDVDECDVYGGGPMGCQNNATCENVANGFICHCPKGFHGPLCQYEQGSCRKHPGICGRGHCVDAMEEDVADYRCICENGYKLSSDKENPTCIDINECEQNPCHPGVDCINLPGSFMCSGCPKGLYGNGIQCADIDECSEENYPCSTNPRASCINTYGSYICGACPPGYRGDGKTCTKYSKCASKPCFPGANCTDAVDNLNAGGFLCHCPEGYLGDGIGLNGCKKGNSSVCRVHGKCYNGGTCKAIAEDSYLCMCPEGYLGSRCEKASECLSSPCKNGGTCQFNSARGYDCLCPPGFYGDECQSEEDSCGAHFSDREGNFTYSSDSTENPKTCDFVISPRTDNEALRVWFTFFANMDNSGLYSSVDCRNAAGNVSLFDGDSDNSNLFATFCGLLSSPRAPWMNTPITMTGGKALFRYKGTKGAFSIKWELRKRECGYRTSVPSGSLVVPTHYQNTSCEWFISAKPDQVIEISIPPLKMGTFVRNCSINQLEIYDGYTSYDNHRVIHYCSNTNETVTVRSTGPFMSVFFTNDLLWANRNSKSLSGFQIDYKFVEPDYKCGGLITNTNGEFDFSGEITSPNYGGFYPPDAHCIWKIDAIGSENSTIGSIQSLKLEFDEFDVVSPFMLSFGSGKSALANYPAFERAIRQRRPLFRSLIKCVQDYLQVYADGNLYWDGCNAHKPPPSLLIPQGKAILQFRSDSKTAGKGFKIKYSVACEKRLRGNGTIQTWNFPDGGVKGKCKYIIAAEPTAAIVVKIKSIEMQTASIKDCYFSKDVSETTEDYVIFSGGKEEDKFLNQKYICPKFPFVADGELTVSATKPLTIEFSSSGSPKNKGIVLEYFTREIGCGGFFSSPTGIISSPNYPNKYLPHMNCIYYITVPWTKQVRLMFDNFDLEVVTNNDCTYDRVEVYDRYTSPTDHGKLLGKFCGSMLPPTLVSTGYQMAVVFNSDRSIAGSGFSARYDTVEVSTHCDQSYTSPTGTITFDSTKGRYTECSFHIALPFNAKIVLNITDMNLPCNFGRLQLRNGADINSPGFPGLWSQSEVCDDHPLTSVLRTHGNRAYLKVILLDTRGVSFNISYEQIISNCGGRVTGVSGSIAAPQYPQKDSRPMSCEWTVAVAPGNRVNFQLAMIDDLKSADDNGFCGVFAANRLDVLDHAHGDAKVLRRYCRKILAADTVESEDHEIAVVYKQQGGIQFGALYGFLAHFNTDCRDILHIDFAGTIQSPGYPDPVYINRFCTWIIKVPKGNRIKVVFHQFDIAQQLTYDYYKKTRDCSSNWLKFEENEIAQATVKYAGSETLNVTQTLSTTCNKVKPLIVMSNSNVLHISFQSKVKQNNKFWLSWSIQGCGGDVRTPANITINKKTFPGNASDAECQWRIEAPVGKKILFRVKKFLVFRNIPVTTFNNDCKWEDALHTGIEAYAGLNNDSGVVQDKFCSAVKEDPHIIRSHSNQMFVRMKWVTQMIQTEQNGEFFQAQVEFVDTNPDDKDECGAVIEIPTDANKTIHSPRFPSEYPKDTHCQWLFKAQPGQHLNFYLKEYRTPNSHPLNEASRIYGQSFNNLTCQHPIQFIEGALTILEGGNKTSKIKDRICLDIKEPVMYEVDTNTSLVIFQGSANHRQHVSGEDEKKRIGFIMDVFSTCGSLEYATLDEQVIRISDMPKTTCNITIRKKDPNDSGIRIRLDEFKLKNSISKHHVPGAPRELLNDEIVIQLDDGVTITRPIELQNMKSLRSPYTHEEFRATNEVKLSIARRTSLLVVQIAVAFSTDIESCGTELLGKVGTVQTPVIVEDTECIWTMNNNPGNKVSFTAQYLDLPESENCAESYVEVRKYNDSGPLMERFCKLAENEEKTITAEALWIKFRYVRPEGLDEEMVVLLDESGELRQHELRFKYTQTGGGVLDTPGTIMEPKVFVGISLQYHIKGTEGKGLYFHVEKANFPEYTPEMDVYLPAGLYFVDHTTGFYSIVNKMRELLTSGTTRAITGWHPPRDVYIPDNEIIVYAIGMNDPEYRFTLHWETIDLEEIPEEPGNETSPAEKKYDCGGILHPTWDWQSLTNPLASTTPPGESGPNDAAYPHDIHCMWQMTKPQLTGIEIKVVKMDLESVNNCAFDFLTIVAADSSEEETEEDVLEHAHKLCKKEDETHVFTYTYNNRLNIHFVTDRNRGGSGFEIQYRYICNSFDFIKKDQGVFQATLTSPGYPNAALGDNCGWVIVLESNRRMSVIIDELNLDPNDCKNTHLTVLEHGPYSSMQSLYNPNKPKFCGAEGEAKNITMKHGRLYLRYYDKDRKHPRGFKVRIVEVLEECTADELVITEANPNMTFYTPLYPKRLPNSLDCDYVVHAPAGHRLQFTVDPRDFNLESPLDNETCYCDACDYLEIHDGPTEHSPLVGRYCGTTAPSTVTTTGNFLFFKIRTDSFAQSAQFKAEIRLASCGGTVVLNHNKTTMLRSPHYPDVYPMVAECAWTVHAPNSHFIESTLRHMWISWTVNCTSDRLTSYDGNITAPVLMGPVCSMARVSQLDYRTSSSMMTVEFIANSTVPKTSKIFCKDKKCGFEMALSVSKEGCGGLIDDNQGVLTAPGYPNRLLPHVRCRWDLRAGPGYRYLLEFEFTDSTRNGFHQIRYLLRKGGPRSRSCFMDLQLIDGKVNNNRPGQFATHYYCEKESTFVTESDIATIIYSDMPTKDIMKFNENAAQDQYYVPFRINYTRVPSIIDEYGCTHKVSTNVSIPMGNFKNESAASDSHYCHISITRPEGYGTTIITIHNYTDEQANFPRDCSEWGSYIEIESDDDDLRTISEKICNASFATRKHNEIQKLYINKNIDIHVKTILNSWLTQPWQKFILTIEFQQCGGIIDDPNMGEITSPGFGERNYQPHELCVWQLRAPEGMVVWMNITDLAIENHVECEGDELRIGEGKDDTTIHRYCQSDESKTNDTAFMLADRFRTHRSHSRYMTLTWRTNDEIELAGWRIEYEFVDEAEGCGFTTHAMSGVVHSPNFPMDYPNDEECLWDIQVPIGYIVELKYTHFDIEASESCVNDALQISDEHLARANEPQDNYYFLFEDEEKKPPQCGIATPRPYLSTSNRIRLNFTTNSRINAKGFRAEWKAKCGGIFQLSHYHIPSPHYPNFYPNEDMECMYLIDPKGENEKSVVVLKVQDFDLSPIKSQYGRYPCESDYVEVIDIVNERTLQVFCGGEDNPEEPVAIRGAIGIKFVANQTFMHGKKKMHRGFSFSYAIRKCGGVVNMLRDEDFVYPLSSPAFPLEYPHDLDCVWNLTTTGDRVFSIKFLSMEIEKTAECDLDWLELIDGDENGTSLGRYCGDKKDMPTANLRTQNNQMLVRFVSDSSMSRGGFKMVITATLGPKHGCGGKLTATSDWQQLTPPLKDGLYYNNLLCGWTIASAGQDSMIEFKLESLTTEQLVPSPGKRIDHLVCVDTLRIYDGYRAFSPMLADNLCTETAPSMPMFFHSSHRVAHVSFETDTSGSEKGGFVLKYRAAAPDCGAWMNAKAGKERITFTSKLKKEARSGQSEQHCQWVITSNEQTPIELSFTNISFPSPDGDCSDAYLEIRDVGSIAKCEHPACAEHDVEKKVVKYCGTVPTTKFISNTMVVQVTASAVLQDEKNSSFIMDVELLSACNRTINGTEFKSGRITSPNYPKPYDHNETCITKIVAPEGSHVLLVFNKFKLETGRPIFYTPGNYSQRWRLASQSLLTYRIPKCDHDWVQVYDTEITNATRQYCGSGLPPSFLSNGTTASVSLQSDYSVSTEGFDISYYTGKYNLASKRWTFNIISDAVGAITNIGYPNGYDDATVMMWSVRPPAGQSCLFEFDVISIAVGTSAEDCQKTDEYLQVELRQRNEKEYQQQRVRSCSHKAPTKFIVEPAEERRINFIFKTDSVTTNNGIGFRVRWDCHL